MTTATQIKAALNTIQAVAECIREVGSIHSGHLYAAMMPQGIDLPSYDRIIDTLCRAGVVAKSGNLLTWKGAA